MADFNVPFSTPDGLTTATLFVSGGATFASNIFAPNIVTSVNGSTGAIVNIAVTGSNTFAGLQTMNAGITANNLSVTQGATFAGTVSSDTGYRISSSAVNAQTGTTYSLTASDNGKIVTMNNGATSTVTVIGGLPIGFNTTVIQLGAGQVGFTAASGVTLNSYSSATKIAGQHGAASVISYTTNIYNLSGTLTI